jgi:signal transduction histidine kinase
LLAEESSGGGDRSFWILFSVGWVLYAGLMVTTAVIEGEALLPRFVTALPPSAFAILIAVNRRLFLRPEWTIWKTVWVHLGIGLAYSVASALGTVGLIVAMDAAQAAFGGEDPRLAAAFFSFYYFLIYAVLAGFMMWSESLRRVQESQALAARESVLRAEAEAKAVRAQFNPHFVFNTLHSLMLLVRADPSAAERAIEDVASLIRYASVLERRNQDVVTLGEEVEIARRYIGLETLRLDDRLKVIWELDPDLEHVPVPPFSLQTLLENAIKHGISPKETGGVIHVRVRGRPGHLTIIVKDDGMGADPEEVRKAEGRGLNLLQRRVATLFGETSSLNWETSPGGGFSAALNLPMAESGGDGRASPSQSDEEGTS